MTKKDNTIFFMLLLVQVAGCWTLKSKRTRILLGCVKVCTVVLLSFAFYTGVADICHTLDDIGNVLYMTCNISLVFVALVKFIIICLFEDEVVSFVTYAQRNFWHSNYDATEKMYLKETRKLCRGLVVFTYIAVAAGVTNYIITPIIQNWRNNSTEKALIYKLYFDSVYVSPYYEMTFLMQAVSTTQVAVCYICFETLLLVLSMHLANQFRILQHRLSNIWGQDYEKNHSVDYTDKCYARLKNCIRQHQTLIEFCYRLESVFKYNILLYVLIISVLLCLSAYQIFFVDAVASRKLIFIIYTCSTVFQVIIFSYSCGILMTESEAISFAVYPVLLFAAPMDQSGRSLRRDMQIIMLRAQKPCCLTACGFFPMCLEASTRLLSTAVSYFTLLRESTTE